MFLTTLHKNTAQWQRCFCTCCRKQDSTTKKCKHKRYFMKYCVNEGNCWLKEGQPSSPFFRMINLHRLNLFNDPHFQAEEAKNYLWNDGFFFPMKFIRPTKKTGCFLGFINSIWKMTLIFAIFTILNYYNIYIKYSQAYS